jgi:hypothetical protein
VLLALLLVLCAMKAFVWKYFQDMFSLKSC